jgi:uncharacterized protein (DUF736 family)
MSQYDNTNRGVLFRNEKKKSEKHPDYDGQVNVEGVDWALSGWIRESKNGKKFLSISVKKPYKEENGVPKEDKRNDERDEIPF